MLSLPFSIVLLVVFAGACVLSQDWPRSVKEFPIVAAIPGILLVFLALVKDGIEYKSAGREYGSFGLAWAYYSEQAVFSKAVQFFGYLIAMLIIMLIIGQKLALPLFMALYLIRWGNYNWRTAIGYAAGGWVLLVGFYDRIMHLFWHPAWIYGWLPELLPSWLPAWLIV